ncbi:unnamed protein product [Diamesa serratosioi]
MSEFNYLRNILNDIQNRIVCCESLPYSFELKEELKHLESLPKLLLKKKIQGIPWNFGSTKVFDILAESKVFTICEYLHGVEDDLEVQKVLNDLLEAPEIQLFCDVFSNTNNSAKVTKNIQDCLSSYVRDVVENPNLIQKNFLTSGLSKLLPEQKMSSLSNQVTSEILHYSVEDDENQPSLEEALSCQQEWNVKFNDPPYKLLSEIITTITKSPSAIALIIKEISTGSPNWYYLLIILRFCDGNSATKEVFTNLYKSLFKKFIETQNESNFIKLVITSRQLIYYQNEDYADFYKKTIGEMIYSKDLFKSNKKENFLLVMNSMKCLVPLERDQDILQISIRIAISSPALCNVHVLEYKEICKSKLQALKLETQDPRVPSKRISHQLEQLNIDVIDITD